MELLVMIGLFISLATLMVNIRRSMKEDFSAHDAKFTKMIDELRGDLKGLSSEVSALGQRIAKLEGVLTPTPDAASGGKESASA